LQAAFIGGTMSVIGGGKFANGAQTGAFQYLYNCLQTGNGCGSTPEEVQGPTLEDIEGDRRRLIPLGVLLAGASAAATLGPGIAASIYESAGGMAFVRYIGAQGEAAVGWIGRKEVILNASGRAFIADGVTFASVNEVKNVATLGLTAQIRAFGDFAVQSGRQFTLWIRSDTVVSNPLFQYIQSIGGQFKTIPGK
jgi:hypothetical protein